MIDDLGLDLQDPVGGSTSGLVRFLHGNVFLLDTLVMLDEEF